MGTDRLRRLVIVALWAACSSRSADKPPPQRQVVARLSALKGSVDHRKAATLVWAAAHASLELFHRDAVKTGPLSSARVTFAGGSQLEIDEQSLVVIEAPPERPAAAATTPSPPTAVTQVAQVERGSVRGVSQPGAPAVKVVTPDGQVAHITAEGNEAVPFRVRVQPGGKLEVAILKGKARVESATGDAVTVSERQVVEVTKQKISAPVVLPPFPELLSPAVDAKFHAGSRVLLKWSPIAGAALYRVQVSDSVTFERRITEETVTVPELSLAGPKPGSTYVWRVSSVDAQGHEGEFGFARRFVVLTATPPPQDQLLSPPENAGVQFTSAPRPVTFSWKSETRSVELVVARGKDLQRVVLRRRVKGATSVVIPGLGAGDYYWGVYAVTPEGKRPLFEKARHLVIARRLPPGVKVPSSIDWK
jgi:hypothetical protein